MANTKFKPGKIYCLISILIFASSMPLFAGSADAQKDEIPLYEIGGEQVNLHDFKIALITDPEGSLGVEEIASRQKPESIESSRFIIPSDKDTFWFVFKLKNSSVEHVDRIIRINESFLKIADLHYLQGGKWITKKSGLEIPIANRNYAISAPVFPVTLAAGETRTFYLKIRSNYVLIIGLAVESLSVFSSYEHWRIAGTWLVFGASFAIILYNLLLFFYVRSLSYLYYVLYGLCFIGFFSAYSGYILQLHSGEDILYAFAAFTPLMIFFILAFTRKILESRDSMPGFDKLFVILMYLFGFGTVLVLIDIHLYKFVIMLATPSALVTIVAGVYGILKGVRIAKYYVIAISAYLFGLFLLGAVNMGIVPYNIFTRYGFAVGSLIELIVFSLALGYRLKILQEEKLGLRNEMLKAEKDSRERLEVVVKERTSQLQKANVELERIATVDGLTGLYNRRHFDNKLSEEWNRLQREDSPLSLIMCDIDYFKSYNDSLGHQEGDDCLRTVAKIIGGCVGRDSDTAARYGGEEFAIILPNTTSEDAVSISEKIREVLAKRAISHPRSESAKVTISFGVATKIPTQQTRSSRLVAVADEALYESKNNGRDRVTVARPDPTI
jgi:diguanylate cyclase (GGDEF)-like protein